MKLKKRLRETPDEELREIAEFWNLAPEDESVLGDADKLVSWLYPRLQTRAAFRQAFDRLEPRQRDIIYFLSIHGGELPSDEFERRCGLHDAADREQALHRLRRRGFVWSETIADESLKFEIIGVPEPLVRLMDMPPYWRGFVGHFLQNLGLPELKSICRGVTGKVWSGRKRQVLVHHLRQHLLTPANLRDAIGALDAQRRELFEHIHHKMGTCVWRDLLDGGAQKKFNHARAELLEEMIRASGLIYVWRAAPNKYNSMLTIPRDVSRIIGNDFRRDERTLDELTQGGASERTSQNGSGGVHPGVIMDNSHNLVRDLVIFLAWARRNRLRMLNNGGIGRNDLKKIAPLLSHNKTTKYVAFLALFCVSRKLLIPVAEEWRVSKTVGEWLGEQGSVYRDMYDFWLGTSEWNEEYVEGDVVHVDHYPQNLIPITELRKLVLRVLEKMPTESWIDFDRFAESLLPQVAIEIPGRFDHAPAEKYNRHTALVIESVIAESCYWFGLVTLGVSDLAVARELGSREIEGRAAAEPNAVSAQLGAGGEFAFAFRPTASARRFFEGHLVDPPRLTARASGEAEGETVHVTVQPNLEIVTPPDIRLGRLYELLSFSDVRKVDIMTTLVVSRESVRAGMEQGMDHPRILRVLAESSRNQLPETVVSLIEECGVRHGEVDVGLAGGYISAGDPMLVEEIRSNPRISRYVKDVFHDRLILLNRTADLKKVTDELEKMGFMPRVASDTIHVTREGLYHLTLRPEELYDMLATLRFMRGLEEDLAVEVWEDKVNALIERLSADIDQDHSAGYYIDPLVTAFRTKFDRLIVRRGDEEKKRLKKQINRLLARQPAKREPDRYKGENPTSDPESLAKMIRWAIEQELQVKIHYVRSSGDEIDEVIEPESLKGDRIYACCVDKNEHHIYSLRRIARAAL